MQPDDGKPLRIRDRGGRRLAGTRARPPESSSGRLLKNARHRGLVLMFGKVLAATDGHMLEFARHQRLRSAHRCTGDPAIRTITLALEADEADPTRQQTSDRA